MRSPCDRFHNVHSKEVGKGHLKKLLQGQSKLFFIGLISFLFGPRQKFGPQNSSQDKNCLRELP